VRLAGRGEPKVRELVVQPADQVGDPVLSLHLHHRIGVARILGPQSADQETPRRLVGFVQRRDLALRDVLRIDHQLSSCCVRPNCRRGRKMRVAGNAGD
jgi:hypothetical protein